MLKTKHTFDIFNLEREGVLGVLEQDRARGADLTDDFEVVSLDAKK